MGLGTSTAAFDMVGTDIVAARIDAGATTERYVFAPGLDEPMAGYDAAGARLFFHADERGSIVARSDAAGSAAGRTLAYDEYGRASAYSSRFLFAGKMHLGGVNAYYNNARFYDYDLGRFLQPDPIGYGAGVNLYAYVGGDPVNFTDPLGLCGPNEVPVARPRTSRGTGDVVALYTIVCTPLPSGNGSSAGAAGGHPGQRTQRGVRRCSRFERALQATGEFVSGVGADVTLVGIGAGTGGAGLTGAGVVTGNVPMTGVGVMVTVKGAEITGAGGLITLGGAALQALGGRPREAVLKIVNDQFARRLSGIPLIRSYIKEGSKKAEKQLPQFNLCE